VTIISLGLLILFTHGKRTAEIAKVDDYSTDGSPILTGSFDAPICLINQSYWQGLSLFMQAMLIST